MYRLVFAGFNYNTVFHQMTPQEIELANAALDEQIYRTSQFVANMGLITKI